MFRGFSRAERETGFFNMPPNHCAARISESKQMLGGGGRLISGCSGHAATARFGEEKEHSPLSLPSAPGAADGAAEGNYPAPT